MNLHEIQEYAIGPKLPVTGIPRPASISTSGSTGGSFNSGAYLYDGAGNIQKINLDTFVYDARSRLMQAYGKNYTYDRWGNLNPTPNRVDPATNRLMPSLGSYDFRGNLVGAAGQSYSGGKEGVNHAFLYSGVADRTRYRLVSLGIPLGTGIDREPA